MTGERVLPNLGLKNLWTAGSNGWSTGMDADLAMLDALIFLTVKSSTLTAPPDMPVSGDRYIVAPSATGAWAGQDKAVTVYIDGGWIFYAPRIGWKAYVLDVPGELRYLGGAWTADSAGGGTATPAAQSLPLPFVLPGKPAAGAVYNLAMATPCTFPANLAGSRGYAGTGPSATASFTAKRLPADNSASTTIGTITFAAGAARPTFSNQAGVSFVAGDVLQLTAPASQDAALSDVSITLLSAKA